MAAERLSMRKLRELFRLRFEAKLTTWSIATSLGIGNGTVCDYVGRARVAKRTWPLPPELDDDAALTTLLFPEDAKALAERPEPDWARVHAGLKKKGVTKLLLWQEYLEAVPGGGGPPPASPCARSTGPGRSASWTSAGMGCRWWTRP
jgi:hypothetical protein